MTYRLRDAMREVLAGWPGDLDAAWRPILGDTALGFEDIDPSLELAVGEPIFPPRRHQTLLGAPPGAHMFKAFDGVEPAGVRCVVVGQDPHPSVGQATGVGFEFGQLASWHALEAPVGHELSRLLTRTLFQLIVADRSGDPGYAASTDEWHRARDDFGAGHRSVEPMEGLVDIWKAQGVLLLNTSLTLTRFSLDIDPHYSRGHRPLWAPLLQAVLDYLLGRDRAVVIIGFGTLADAALRALLPAGAITSDGSAAYLAYPHPAEGDALLRRGNPLTECNVRLAERGLQPIRW